MPGPLTVLPGVVIPDAELAWRFSRSGGPGGQGVNTTDSRAELSWNLAETEALPPVLKARVLERLAGRLVDGILTIAASEHRSQLRNREAAEARLVALVARATEPPRKRRPTRPSQAAKERRIAEKKRRGEIKRTRRTDLD